MTGSHENWFYLAREDLNFARAGLKDGFFTHVCVLAQQAVEKGMKGWLVAHGKDRCHRRIAPGRIAVQKGCGRSPPLGRGDSGGNRGAFNGLTG